MANQNSQRPTESELEILRVLWERGPSTVRDVHSVLSKKRGVGYTTVLKLMQIMFEKRLVARNESQRAHIYSARVKEDVTKRRILRDLVDGVFGGATEQLVLQALNARRVTPEEIESIRRMLDDYEMDQQSRSEHDR